MAKLLRKLRNVPDLFSCASAPSKKAGKSKEKFGGKVYGFEKLYDLDQVIGSGGFGTVYSGRRKSDNKPVAVKFIKRSKVTGWVEVDGKPMPREVWCLDRLAAVDGVVRLLDCFATAPNSKHGSGFIVVMERPERSQDLFDYITAQGRLDETEARRFLGEIVEALVQIQAAGIMHRDLKDENILLDLDTRRTRIIDFGSAVQHKESPYRDFDGTRMYCPPEWLKQRQYRAESATVWSVGILLYDMVCGDIPFNTESKILQAWPTYPDTLSSGVRDLISSCLAVDPEQRPTLSQILSDPWLRSTGCSSIGDLDLAPAAAADTPSTLPHNDSLASTDSAFFDDLSCSEFSRCSTLTNLRSRTSSVDTSIVI
jgi:serine/threonine protein kinase